MQELQSFSFPIGIQLHCAQAGLGSEDELAKGRQAGRHVVLLALSHQTPRLPGKADGAALFL